MAALTAILTGVAAVATGYAAIKGVEGQQQQADELRKQRDREKKLLAEQKASALNVRKELINKKRRQIFGAGDGGDVFQIGRTGGRGITPQDVDMGETLTGRALG